MLYHLLVPLSEDFTIFNVFRYLTFRSGAMAVIDNSRQAVYGYDQRIEVFGSKGLLKVDNAFPYQLDIHDEQGGLSPRPFQFFLDRVFWCCPPIVDNKHLGQVRPKDATECLVLVVRQVDGTAGFVFEGQ